MSIMFVQALPGGGKSYYAMRQLCEELRSGKRHIVTNLPYHEEPLIDWCHKNCEEGGDAIKRIHRLEPHQVLNFWLWYGKDQKIQSRHTLKGEDGANVEQPCFNERFAWKEKHPGVLYIIDEVHIYFGARAWQKTGTDCTSYLSLHRKLGDDVILISQHKDQVDKALRRLTQDWVKLVNLHKTKFMGFTIPKTVRRSLYADEAMQNQIEAGFFRFDFEQYGVLYDTNSGVGISGRLETKEKTGGGRHPLWGIVYAVLFVLAAFVIPKMALAGLGKWSKSIVGSYSSTVTNGVSGIVSPVATNGLLSGSANKTSPPLTNVPTVTIAKTNYLPVPYVEFQKTNTVKIVRRDIVGAYRKYWLSDGTVLRQGDPDTLFAGDDYVIVRGGKTYYAK